MLEGRHMETASRLVCDAVSQWVFGHPCVQVGVAQPGGCLTDVGHSAQNDLSIQIVYDTGLELHSQEQQHKLGHAGWSQ